MPSTIPVDRLLTKAGTMARAGHYLEAHRLYRTVLDHYPQNRRAADGLRKIREPAPWGKGSKRLKGKLEHIATLQRARRVEDAAQASRALAAEYPDTIRVHLLRGALALQVEDALGAVEAFTRAVQLQPTYPDAYRQLGEALKRLGHREEALAAYRQAIAVHPEAAEPRRDLGLLLRELGRGLDAIEALTAAITLAPDDIAARAARSEAHKDLGEYDEAAADLARIAALRPDSADALNSLANALSRAGRHGEAVATYRKALQIAPGHPEAHNNLGVALFEMGDPDGARPHYAAALAARPDYAECHRNLSTITRYAAGDPHIDALRSLHESASIGEAQRMHVAFALFKAHDDLGAVDTAFAYLEEGNAIRKRLHPYDGDKVRTTIAGIKRFFAAGAPPQLSMRKTGDRTPIFIVGMPRSGTTLVEQILASHPSVSSAGEIMAFERALLPHAEAIREATATTLDPAIVATFRRDYLAALDRVGKGPFVTDKMLVNARWIGFIAMAFPEAPIIRLKRDGMATGWSIYRHYFASRGNNYAYDQRDIAGHYRLQADLMAFWHKVCPGRVHDLCYEELVDDQKHETHRLLAACGLPWDAACLDFHRTDRAVATASTAQVRQALYKGSGEGWRRYRAHLGPMIDGLGIGPPCAKG
ncbi:tetratricopeptide repeat protein [Acuticoccus sp. M5D2P5]|uniref:tetratricopeptide repeat-containing sulfotransferase family protein n=1 Tax=Acuticoccus kalidii TaxID=2910977 RepID=UPI001F1EBBA9|nr:tetratricopeptide repeat-containing sulfotransferase family protein [Acuticoccus kalidii]MCF3934171.1 tetratricopeptide repeat protein [Acuticoccus kalidii]